MIIIAESGSTKTNWLTQDKQLFETIGFNPLFHTPDTIYAEMQKHEELKGISGQIDKVFFYGASCSSPDRKKIISDAMTKFFDKAEVINVDHDLKAAAIATYTGGTGIACILGTGSNSCLYDGSTIYEEVPSLGYVLGDEGSGAWFGKKLLSLFLYKELPPSTMSLLKDKYGLEKELIFDNVYKKPYANVYLASFAKVMTESPDVAFMEGIAKEGFNEFFKHHVCCYENYVQYPVHFVGSIAFFYKDVLQRVAMDYSSQLGIVDRNPVYRLLDWHLK